MAATRPRSASQAHRPVRGSLVDAFPGGWSRGYAIVVPGRDVVDKDSLVATLLTAHVHTCQRRRTVSNNRTIKQKALAVMRTDHYGFSV